MYYTRILMKNCQNKKFLKFKMAKNFGTAWLTGILNYGVWAI